MVVARFHPRVRALVVGGWFLACLLPGLGPAARADPPKVLLQGFWWNYWNNNHPASWADYLARLAPRLRELGIDAVWIPPTIKNQNATGSVGYAPFDHYDLGDKFQCGSTRTRFGTKDEYLRCVAILHANGIQVIQDVVFNHLSGAGSATGAGGSDPAAPGDTFKNFRYACWATPATSETAAHYLARRGRFPKNWQNFHPNPDHNTSSGDVTSQMFGPDVCYYRLARGLSSNATFNPVQPLDPMRNGMRAWVVWLRQQTGVDGLRMDAVKHFEPWAAKDFAWNAAYNAGVASLGPDMFCVGEYVGGAAELDAWVDATNQSDGFADVVGTFDFSLRGALKAMTDARGAFDMGTLPGAQQQRRSRTVPFVNSHDTFRPVLDAAGRYVGWDSANEIGGHIDPADDRIQAAHAVAFAVDGVPCVFFEDLFDLHSTRRRWTHAPADPVALPVRDYLRNLLWCHRNLRFKDVPYLVRWQAQDLLAIERRGRAVILASDHPSRWQSAVLQTAFSPGSRLKDYSGASAAEVVVDGLGRASLAVPPTDGSSIRRGYAVWAPAGIGTAPAPAPMPTTQEWEMADDLGDSHPSSLRQGGALPASSMEPRTVGRIHAGLGRPVTVRIQPVTMGVPLRAWLEDHRGARVSERAFSGTFSWVYEPLETSWLTLRLAHASATNPSQVVRARITYTATRDLDFPAALNIGPPTLDLSGRWTVPVEGPPDVRAAVESSEDLVHWSAWEIVDVPGAFATTPTDARRFFRIRAVP